MKKLFRKVSQNLQENACAGVYFSIKFPTTLCKMRLNHSNCFPLKFMKFYRIVFFAENIQVTDSKLCIFFFSIRVFFTGTDVHRTAGEGRRPSFIPLYHFHPPTNIETFICNFACGMTITYF